VRVPLWGVQPCERYGRSRTIHGYLVWIALIWSLACTLVTHIIGRWLQPLNVERQHREADYRATLLRIRDHAEQIALYRGEHAEQARLHERFGRIRDNWRELITREFKLEVFSTAYLRVSFFIPVVATLPMYLAKTMSFGSMMQAGTAFSSVQDGFGWFMDYYKRIMEWAAVVERLGRFQEAMAAVDGQKPAGADDGAQMPLIDVAGLALHSAEGRLLARGVHFSVQPSEWLLVDGRSGVGKSTLLRTLAGLWPWHAGHFRVAPGSLFLPQRPIRIFIGDFLGGPLGHARVGQGLIGDFQLVVGNRDVARIVGKEETRVGNQLVTMKKYEGALCGFHRHGIVVRRVLLHALEGHPAEVGAGIEVVVLHCEIKLVAAALNGDFLSGCPQPEGGFD